MTRSAEVYHSQYAAGHEYAAYCTNVPEVHLLEWSAKVNNCVLTFDQSFVVVSNGAHCNLNNECRVTRFLQFL